MKKIITAKEREEKDQRNKTWMTVIIVVILAASSAGFALNFVTTQSRSYNGLAFTQTDQGWQPRGFQILSTYLPQDVENITSQGSFSLNDFSSKAYLIVPPYMQSYAVELVKYLPLKNIQEACVPADENVSYCSNLPLKSCEDANPQTAIIIFSDTNETSVKYNGYCLQISGDSGSILKASDKALFMAYGIIKV